jgi:hypothetical protein
MDNMTEEIEKKHKQTWVYNKEYAETHTCETCKVEMPIRFSKSGIPMDNTKLYVKNQKHGGIVYRHRNVLVCASNLGYK